MDRQTQFPPLSRIARHISYAEFGESICGRMIVMDFWIFLSVDAQFMAVILSHTPSSNSVIRLLDLICSYCISLKYNLPGQRTPESQIIDSVSFPRQILPPCCGEGSLHVLRLSWWPSSQVTEHADQFDQTDQEPSTLMMKI